MKWEGDTKRQEETLAREREGDEIAHRDRHTYFISERDREERQKETGDRE